MKSKVQFPSLNGLRFLAAFGVVIHHTEMMKSLCGLPNCWSSEAMVKLGGSCVSLFFVLSGFLITFLLIEEKKTFQSINVRNFYIRRALRIWPLYFIICILGFLVIPAFSIYNMPTFPPVWDNLVWLKGLLYCTFCPQIAAAWLPPVAYAGVLWSVGIEEWFYLIWPWVIKMSRRWEIVFLMAVIASLALARSMVPGGTPADVFFYQLRFDCMAVGALFALLLHSKDAVIPNRVLSFCYRLDVQLIVYTVLIAGIIRGATFGLLSDFTYSVLFGMIILNLATNQRSIISLETPALRWLGDISYGLYCYNLMTIMSAILIVKHLLPVLRHDLANLVTYAMSIGLTVLVSGLSYEFVERRFLLLKKQRFTRIPTIDPATIRHTTQSPADVVLSQDATEAPREPSLTAR